MRRAPLIFRATDPAQKVLLEGAMAKLTTAQLDALGRKVRFLTAALRPHRERYCGLRPGAAADCIDLYKLDLGAAANFVYLALPREERQGWLLEITGENWSERRLGAVAAQRLGLTDYELDLE